MNGFFQHMDISLRLHFRNWLALLYGYLFPLVFLAVFGVLYRGNDVPILNHLGALLTISVLGGACFGLPTTLVSERERGVWRRYRLTPVPTWSVVMSAMVARYFLLLSAGLLQLAAALALGMTHPEHPFALWVAFTLTTFALMGLGLVIAALADNVPAVQAFGQCIFLPMLVIGGVAVSLASLPTWAQHVAAFFPGRYAVEALQESVTGRGLSGMRFSLLALALTGAGGMLAGVKLFRWDAQQRFAAQIGKGWIAPVFAVCLATGLLAEARGRIAVAADGGVAVERRPVATARPPAPWEAITPQDVTALNYRVPSDDGVVAPIALPDEEPDESTARQIESLRGNLPNWAPGGIDDDVQRVRNLLCVAALPDVAQHPTERFVPVIVLQQLLDTYPKAKLIKLLTWVAAHPAEGTVIEDITILGIPATAGDPDLVRERVTIYAIKFVARLTKRPTG